MASIVPTWQHSAQIVSIYYKNVRRGVNFMTKPTGLQQSVFPFMPSARYEDRSGRPRRYLFCILNELGQKNHLPLLSPLHFSQSLWGWNYSYAMRSNVITDKSNLSGSPWSTSITNCFNPLENRQTFLIEQRPKGCKDICAWELRIQGSYRLKGIIIKWAKLS